MPSKCQECNSEASYGPPDVKSRTVCAKHKKPGMIYKKKLPKGCLEPGCSIHRPAFNYEGEKKGIYCVAHKLDKMINVLVKPESKCVECKVKSPTFGLPDGKATHCGKCRTKLKLDLVDLVSNLCDVDGCQTNATRGFPGEKPTKCKKHAQMNMIDVKNKKCQHPGCDKQPTYGLDKCTHCIEHKTDEMVDIKHDTEHCSEPDCKTRATYGFIGEKASRCKEHIEDGMVDTVSKMCITCNMIQPVYNYKNVKPPLYCNNCKLHGMVNIMCSNCASCGLFYVKSKDGLCSYCNPDAHHQTREATVVDFLRSKGLSFIHNKSVGKVCGSYRPDIKIDCLTHLVIVEVDEDQHAQYDDSCEIARMLNIYQAEGLPCVFLRYNPDQFKIGNEKRAHIVKQQVRLEILYKEIQKWVMRVPNSNIKVFRLFYTTKTEEFVEKFRIKEIVRAMYEHEKETWEKFLQ